VTSTLKETTNPEEKRKIIGDTFMHVSNDVIKVCAHWALWPRGPGILWQTNAIPVY
jgi:GMP synthase PP-ATPase subunit